MNSRLGRSECMYVGSGNPNSRMAGRGTKAETRSE